MEADSPLRSSWFLIRRSGAQADQGVAYSVPLQLGDNMVGKRLKQVRSVGMLQIDGVCLRNNGRSFDVFNCNPYITFNFPCYMSLI